MAGLHDIDDEALSSAYLHCYDNRKEIERSRICYCICCGTFVQPSEINSYVDDGRTAICPRCDCDAIIGDGCGIGLDDNLLAALHDRYFDYSDIEDTGMEIYIVTDLLFAEGAYRFNAVYAFKSKTSVESYEKYLKSTGENHRPVLTMTTVSNLERSLQVITEFEVNGDLSEYKSTTILEDYDDAREYVADIKAARPSVSIEHDVVKIQSRFSPSILHSGWA